jgi:hypothetical protein
MPHTSNGSRGTAGSDIVLAGNSNGHHFYGYGEGYDILVGGYGDDVFEMEADSLLDILAAGRGEDTLDYSEADTGLSVDLNAGTTYSVPGGTDREFPVDPYQSSLVTIFSGIENVTGTDYADVFAGNWADNEFDGGSGIDRLTYANATQGVTIDFRNDTVTGHSVGTDTFSNIELVEGSRFDDTWYASNASDTFVFSGHFGDDTIYNYDSQGNVHDYIRFEGLFEDWEDLEDHIDRDGNDWTIHLDNGSTITLMDVQGNLGENDFIFA